MSCIPVAVTFHISIGFAQFLACCWIPHLLTGLDFLSFSLAAAALMTFSSQLLAPTRHPHTTPIHAVLALT